MLVGTSTPSIDNAAVKIESDVENGIEISNHEDPNDLSDLILQESLHEVSRLHGLRVSTDAGDKLQLDNAVEKIKLRSKLLSPLLILESQTASTEIRGGQAGGYSCLEYEGHLKENMVISSKRVRLVARKRHPLAADLAVLYKKRGGKTPNSSALLSVIGHTRFATSSVNKVSGRPCLVLSLGVERGQISYPQTCISQQRRVAPSRVGAFSHGACVEFQQQQRNVFSFRTISGAAHNPQRRLRCPRGIKCRVNRVG